MAPITFIAGCPPPVSPRVCAPSAPAAGNNPGGVQVAATKPQPEAATSSPPGLGQVVNRVA